MKLTVDKIEVSCQDCSLKFFVYPSRISQGRGKFCSKTCRSRFSMGKRVGDKAAAWKGDGITYGSMHNWISHVLGRPSLCENCETTTAVRFEWANLSGEYKRDISDWARLCKSCHMLIDDVHRKSWRTRHEVSSPR